MRVDVIRSEKREFLEMFEVGLLLDSYDDIFSDFDPRPLSERALSYDFLDASKRATRDKPSGSIELKLLVPSRKRDVVKERVIRSRLDEYFRFHHEFHRSEMRRLFWGGFGFTFSGVLLMLFASFILFSDWEKTFFLHFVVVLLEPGGWFLFWEGLSMVIFERSKRRGELDFYRKMSACRISFVAQ